MDTTTQLALRVLVESAVRPVHAGPIRKQRMREAMLAQLREGFEKEASLAGEREALNLATQRFGNPAQKTLELESQCPALAWVGWATLYLIAPPARASFWKRALCHFVLACLVYCPAIVITALVVFPLMSPATTVARLQTDMLLSAAFQLGVAASLIFTGHALWHCACGPARSWWAAGACLVFAAFLGPALAFVATVASPEEANEPALRRLWADLPGIALTVPYALLFVVDLIRRVLRAPAPRTVLRCIAVEGGTGFLLALAALLIGMGMGLDWGPCLPNALGVLGLTFFWLLPLDLFFSTRWFFERLRTWQEWEGLPVAC